MGGVRQESDLRAIRGVDMILSATTQADDGDLGAVVRTHDPSRLHRGQDHACGMKELAPVGNDFSPSELRELYQKGPDLFSCNGLPGFQ
jgi:hypothetical protein